MAESFHSSERCFRRYERIIAAIVQRFPGQTSFRCTKRSPVTDAARLHDAITSYRLRNWSTDLIDRKKFVDDVYKQIDIEPTHEGVTIGPKRIPLVETVEPSGGGQFSGSVSRPRTRQIDIAILAVEHSVVEGPIELSELTPEQLEYIETTLKDCFNVASKRDGTTIILI